MFVNTMHFGRTEKSADSGAIGKTVRDGNESADTSVYEVYTDIILLQQRVLGRVRPR